MVAVNGNIFDVNKDKWLNIISSTDIHQSEMVGVGLFCP